MKLFALPDGAVDNEERAAWLTPIFDWDLTPDRLVRLSAVASVNTAFAAPARPDTTLAAKVRTDTAFAAGARP